ncbi:MAG TPA: 50S ribosomal protein L30 [Cytophagales bacterium]|nr:50S ribosomal protein L30 [Cytophagales bacterium]HAA23128.1 50S ribosomal protein L30 [Cytophagales bacterium]HAP61710.1 50S ribosomal protein L30 [Cytophagales bacterium]
MAKLQVTQIRSAIGRSSRQKATLVALGLGRIGKQVEVEPSASIEGMINKVAHLVTVKEL